MEVLSRVAPFFLLIMCGAVVARARLIDLAGARALSTYVFWVAFPALLVHSLSATPPPDAGMWAGLGAYAAGAAAPLFLTLLAGRALGWNRRTRAGAAMASVGGNTAFLGAPLAVSLFGAAAAGPAAAVIAIDTTLIMALATGAVRGAADDDPAWRAALKTLKNPLVVAALAGAGLSLFGYVPIAPIERALSLLGATASPVGLAALGVVIGLEAGKPAPGETPPVAWSVVMKLFAAPALVWLLVGFSGADPLFRATATLLAACPTAVNVFIQTRTFDVFARGGAMAVVAGTVLGAVTLPLVGALLSG